MINKNCVKKLLKILKEKYIPFVEKEHTEMKKSFKFGKREIVRNYSHIRYMKRYIKELEDLLNNEEGGVE